MHCRTRQLSIYPQLVLRRRLNFIHDLIMKALDCILKPHDAISSCQLSECFFQAQFI